jgi:glycine/D-amino acid oxidase-like deaminating enzyme
LPSDNNRDFVILGGGVAGVTFALEASRRGTFRYLNLDAAIREGLDLAGSLCQGP